VPIFSSKRSKVIRTAAEYVGSGPTYVRLSKTAESEQRTHSWSLGDRDAGSVLGSESGHGDLGLVSSFFRLFDFLLSLAVLGQVDRSQFFLL